MALTGKQWQVWRHLQETGQRICCWSVRALALALKISRSTVEIALRVLNALGIIHTRPGDRTHASQHEILRTVTISQDTSDPIHRDTPAIGTPESGHPGPIGTPQSGHPPAEFCPNCGVRLQQGSHASANSEPSRARLTTDLLPNVEKAENQQVGQSVVLGWLEDHFGRIGSDLRRRFEVALANCRIPEELIVRFFEEKLPQAIDRYQKGRLSFVDPGLLLADLRGGQARAWVNHNRELLAREQRWNEQVAEAERHPAKGMSSAESNNADSIAQLQEWGYLSKGAHA